MTHHYAGISLTKPQAATTEGKTAFFEAVLTSLLTAVLAVL